MQMLCYKTKKSNIYTNQAENSNSRYVKKKKDVLKTKIK